MEQHSGPADAGDERIRRLFAWLDEIARRGGGQYMLERAWARLASLLDASAFPDDDAPPANRTGIRETAEQIGLERGVAIRDAISRARLLESGSDAWWYSVAAARVAYSDRPAAQDRPS